MRWRNLLFRVTEKLPRLRFANRAYAAMGLREAFATALVTTASVASMQRSGIEGS